MNERWAGFLFGSVRCEFEAGVRPTDGFSWALSPGVGHRFPNGLNLGLGVAFIDRVREDLLIIPGPQFQWKIDERWSTEFVGTEFSLAHRFSGRWALAFVAGFDSPRTRLNDSGARVLGDLHGLAPPAAAPRHLDAAGLHEPRAARRRRRVPRALLRRRGRPLDR